MYHNPTELDSIPHDKHEAIRQYEWWRPGYSNWKRLTELDDSHLENLKSWLLQNAADFYYKSEQHTGMHHPSDWMRSQPLFISITHELQVRENKREHERMLRRHVDINATYAFTPRANSRATMSPRTDLVMIHSIVSGKMHLVDAITGRSLWTNIPMDDFVQNSVKVTIEGNMKQHGTVTGKLTDLDLGY